MYMYIHTCASASPCSAATTVLLPAPPKPSTNRVTSLPSAAASNVAPAPTAAFFVTTATVASSLAHDSRNAAIPSSNAAPTGSSCSLASTAPASTCRTNARRTGATRNAAYLSPSPSRSTPSNPSSHGGRVSPS